MVNRTERRDGWTRRLSGALLRGLVRMTTGVDCPDANVPYRLMSTNGLLPVVETDRLQLRERRPGGAAQTGRLARGERADRFPASVRSANRRPSGAFARPGPRVVRPTPAPASSRAAPNALSGRGPGCFALAAALRRPGRLSWVVERQDGASNLCGAAELLLDDPRHCVLAEAQPTGLGDRGAAGTSGCDAGFQ